MRSEQVSARTFYLAFFQKNKKVLAYGGYLQ